MGGSTAGGGIAMEGGGGGEGAGSVAAGAGGGGLDDEDDAEEEEYDSVPQTMASSGTQVLPWGAPRERSRFPSSFNIDTDIRPGEFVMRTLFAEFTVQADKKISAVMEER